MVDQIDLAGIVFDRETADRKAKEAARVLLLAVLRAKPSELPEDVRAGRDRLMALTRKAK